MQAAPSDPITTLYHVAVIITGIGTILGGVAFAFYMVRANGYKMLAKEWEELAQVKAAKITDLENKVSALEKRIDAVVQENESLRLLNFDLQKRLSAAMQEG